MDETDDSTPMTNVDAEMKELLGLFDVPAFARRGQDLEYALARLHDRCRRERLGMLDMVRLRLRQWSRAATGPDDWRTTFAAPIDRLLAPLRRRAPRLGRPPRAGPPSRARSPATWSPAWNGSTAAGPGSSTS